MRLDKTLAIFLVSVILFIVLIQFFIGIENIINILIKSNPLVLLLSLFVFLTGIAIWGIRWKMLFNKINLRISWRDIYKYLLIGLMVNNLTPIFRFGGEPVRSYLAAKKISASQDKVFATISMDSFVQFISFLFFAYLSTILLSIFNVPIWSMFFVIINISVLIILSIAFILTQKKILKKLIFYLSKMISIFSKKNAKKFPNSVNKLLKNLKKITVDKRFFIKIASLSFIERIIDVLTLYMIFIALDYPLSFVTCAIAIGIGFITGSVPLFPGGLVTYESGIIIVLSILGVPANISAAGIFIWRLFSYWLVTFTGFTIAWISGIKVLDNR